MTEVFTEEGKLIATIHDPMAFAQLLDKFEVLLQDYSPLQAPLKNLIPHLKFLVDQNTIDSAVEAASSLRELRRRLGDERDDLYPVDIPNAGEQP